jgi:hypothetical protein
MIKGLPINGKLSKSRVPPQRAPNPDNEVFVVEPLDFYSGKYETEAALSFIAENFDAITEGGNSVTTTTSTDPISYFIYNVDINRVSSEKGGSSGYYKVPELKEHLIRMGVNLKGVSKKAQYEAKMNTWYRENKTKIIDARKKLEKK